jgi:hypothetical protein
MDPFLIGFLFATAEVVATTVMEQLFRPELRRLLQGVVVGLPAFLAFAFIVGVAAEWINDTKENHTSEMLVATVVWISCLIAKNITEHKLLWLKGSWTLGQYGVWQGSVCAILLTVLFLALALYWRWNHLTGLAIDRISNYAQIAGLLYLLALFVFMRRARPWVLKDCRNALCEIIDLYCKTSPGMSGDFATNPTAHEAQGCEYFIAKFVCVRDQKLATDRCLCLEEELLRTMNGRFLLSEKEIREAIRAVVKAKASDVQLEYYCLAFVVARDPLYSEAKNFLRNARRDPEHMSSFERMRYAVDRAKRLIDPIAN